MSSTEIRQRARDAIAHLATHDGSTPLAEQARTELATLLETELTERISALPPHVAATLTAWGPKDGAFDGVNHSLRRHVAAGGQDWLAQHAAMPELVRAFVWADEASLDRVIENAGLVHVAMLASGLDETRRVRLLSGLEPAQSARATTYLRRPPEPVPRREVVKGRLNTMLSLAEPSGLNNVPRRLGFDAVAHWLGSLPTDQHEHVRRAWPEAVYNEVSHGRTDTEEQWSLSETTWLGLLSEAGSGVES